MTVDAASEVGEWEALSVPENRRYLRGPQWTSLSHHAKVQWQLSEVLGELGHDFSPVAFLYTPPSERAPSSPQAHLLPPPTEIISQLRKKKSTVATSGPTFITMAPIALTDIVSALPVEESWGPSTTTETLVNGVPYAPYSKGDKLGRMADWTTEGKDGKDGRGGRQQYNRNYRGSPTSPKSTGQI